MTILAIETSCDETSAAVVRYQRGRFEVLSNVVSSQIKIHKEYGGVVPEVAARKQVELIIPVIDQALHLAAQQLKTDNLKLMTDLDALAVTVGPGLMIALSVGVETARTLAAVWKKPIVDVNHLEGHLYSTLLPELSKLQAPSSKLQINPKSQIRNTRYQIRFPAVALIVSGGHTELVLVKDYLKYKLLGRTRDDAAGEAYDKVAKLMGLGYPGGPIIDRLAQKGDPRAFNFPRGMIGSGDYDFSFAGLKTAVLYTLQRQDVIASGAKQSPRDRHGRLRSLAMTSDLCASFQAAVTDVLVAKTIRAAQEYKAKTILLGGGVAANSQLRTQLVEKCTGERPLNPRTGAINRAPTILLPHLSYTTDNAAMIAAAAAFHAERKHFTPWQKLKADPHLTL